MATGRLLVLPSALILLLYIRNLLAIVEEKARTGKRADGVLSKAADGLDLWPGEDTLETLADSLALHSSDGWSPLASLHSALPVTFDPPTLDFGELAIGMPVLREVTIVNPTNSLTLQLTSISGDLPDFQTSFFKSKVLRAGETTSFDIVFLPRALGPVEDTLHIHSSLGNFDFEVKGTGVVNPFRLKAMKGARIPVNATYSPLISMYNPFGVSLQVLEVYSTGERLQLQLPTGVDEASSALWEIRPYETKPIAKVNFYGSYPSNHTAYVRIKTNHPSKPSIVLPVEVEVCETTGLFLSRELLDFGMLKFGEAKSLPIYLWNAGSLQVEIRSIVSVPDNPAIKIEYSNTTLKSGSKYTKVATVTFSVDSSQSDSVQESGLLKVWAEDRSSFHQLTVPYEVDLLKGSLIYDKALTLFRVYDPPFQPVLRNISLLNQFDFPVVVYSAKLSSKAQSLFNIVSLETPYIIPANSDWHSPLVLKFQAQSSECLFNTSLRLSTNASYFNIPLQCYDGRLEYDFGAPEIDALEFGLLSNHDSSSKTFSIRNPNPMKLSITDVAINQPSTLPHSTVHIVSLPQFPDGPSAEILWDSLRPPYVLEPGQSIVFGVNITRPERPGSFSGEILIHSSLGKILPVPVNYKAVMGNIQTIPSSIQFESVFPFSTSTIILKIQSTYTQPVPVLSLVVVSHSNLTASNCPSEQVEDTEMDEYEEAMSWCDHPHPPVELPPEFPVLKPSTTTTVGKLVFNPRLLLPEFVYTGAKLDLTEKSSQDDPTPLSEEVKQLDFLWGAWQTLVDRGWTWFNFSVVLSTEAESGHVIPAAGSLHWPHLSSQFVNFPLTIIGNSSERTLHLHNPSNTHPIFVEPMLLSDCSTKPAILRSLAEKFDLDTSIFNLSSASFSVFDHQHFSTSLHSQHLSSRPVPVTRLVLAPSENRTLRIGFSPDTEQWSHGLLLLRNNLTALDYVHLQGQSSRGFVTVGGVHPGGPQQLVFEFTKSMMEECSRVSECGYAYPYFSPMTLPRILHVQNSSPNPMTISRATLGRTGRCQTSGFRISNCEKQFIVYPNRTRKIEIECTPDYTLSRITETLNLHTSSGVSYEFPLLCTLPHHMLSSCYVALPHLDMESLAAYISVPVWLLALLVMVVVTVLQVNWHASRLQQTTTISRPGGVDVPKQATGGIWFDLNHLQSAFSEKMTAFRKRMEAKSKETNAMVSSSVTSQSSYLPSKPAPTVSATNLSDTSSDIGKLPTSSHQADSTELMHDSKLAFSKNETEFTAGTRSKPISTAMRLSSSGRSSNTSSSGSHHSASLTRDSSPLRASSSTMDYQTGMRVESARTGPVTVLDGPPQQPSSGNCMRKNSSPSSGTGLASGIQDNSAQAVSIDAGTGTRRTKQGRKQPVRPEVKQASKVTPESSPALSTNACPSSSLPSSSLAVDEPKPELFVRKESDESIHFSESENSGLSTTGSDNSPDTEESPTSTFAPSHHLSHQAQQPQLVTTEKLVVRVKPVQHQPSYTKEPGTGQTVPVKENGSDDGSTSVSACAEDEIAASDSGSWTHPLTTKKEASPALPLTSSFSKPRSKKKLRAQLKREEKQKRRQKERESLSSSKAMNGSQESIDKESVASNSTNSTDNFEDEAPLVLPVETPGEQQVTGKGEGSCSPTLGSNTQVPAKLQGSSSTDAADNNDGGLPAKADFLVSTSVSTEGSPEDGVHADKNGLPAKLSTDSSKEKDGFVVSQATLLDSQATAVKEASKTVTLAPSSESFDSKPHRKLQEIYSDVFSRSPDKSTYTTKNGCGKKQGAASDKVKPLSEMDAAEPGSLIKKGVTEDNHDDKEEEKEDFLCPDLHSVDTSSALDSATTQGTPPRTRPQKLEIAIPDIEDSPASEPPIMDPPPSQVDSVECDGANNSVKAAQSSKVGHTSPHEIAASLLSSNQSILRRSKRKNEKEKSVSPEDVEIVTSATVSATNKPTSDKYLKPEVEHHRASLPPDHPSEHRSNFSVDAPPYVPPHPHYQYNYPPPTHHHRRPLLQPPHRMASPPYEYPLVRPYTGFQHDEPGHGYPEQAYERRGMRKRSDYTKFHHPKSFTPSPSHHYVPLGDVPFSREHHRPPLLGTGSIGGPGMYDSNPEWGSGGMHDPSYMDVAEDPRTVLPHGGVAGGGHYRELQPTMVTGSHVTRERSVMHSRRPVYDVSPGISSLHSHPGSVTYNPDDEGPLWDHRFGHGHSEDFSLDSHRERDQFQREQARWKLRRQLERERQQQHHSELAQDMQDHVYRRRRPDPIDTLSSIDLGFSDIPSYSTEEDSLFSETVTRVQRPLQHQKQHRRQLFSPPGLVSDMDNGTDMSTLLPPLNRAPGSTRERSSTTGPTLLSDVMDHSAHNQVMSKWPRSPVEDHLSPFSSLRKEGGHSWQTGVWGLETSVLSSALQEQHQSTSSSRSSSALLTPAHLQASALGQTTEKNDTVPSHEPFSGNTYDLFDRSGRGGIWSFSNDESGLFSWAANLGQTRERSE